MSRFIRLSLHGGEPVLVNVDHVTHALAHDPEGSILMLTGTEGGDGEDVHPPFMVVGESLDEVERLLTGEPVAPPLKTSNGWQMLTGLVR